MRLLNTQVVLRDCRKRDPFSRVQLGDVGELADGRIMARCAFGCADGTTAYGYRPYSRGERPDAAPAIVAPTDWSKWIDTQLERTPDRFRQLDARDLLSAEERERAEFAKQYPYTAARIYPESPPPRAALFALGVIFYPYREAGLPWRRLLEDHAAGSFGVHGQYAEAPLTPEELFMVGEQPVFLQNRVAIASYSGAVRSRYLLPLADATDRTEQRERGSVDIVTTLSPRGPRTLITRTYPE